MSFLFVEGVIILVAPCEEKLNFLKEKHSQCQQGRIHDIDDDYSHIGVVGT